MDSTGAYRRLFLFLSVSPSPRRQLFISLLLYSGSSHALDLSRALSDDFNLPMFRSEEFSIHFFDGSFDFRGTQCPSAFACSFLLRGLLSSAVQFLPLPYIPPPYVLKQHIRRMRWGEQFYLCSPTDQGYALSSRFICFLSTAIFEMNNPLRGLSIGMASR